MILMPQIFDVTANENARYKRNELELNIAVQTRRYWYLPTMDGKVIASQRGRGKVIWADSE